MSNPFLEEFIANLPDVPTESQKDFIHRFERFLRRKEKRSAFILRGYAGTGKTTVIAALVTTLKKFHLPSVLLAPTGRAAKVAATNAHTLALTIHKKIYYVKRNAEGNFIKQLATNRHKNTFFIVDESSMISGMRLGSIGGKNSSLLDDLVDFVYSGENCRLIFVGDVAQLPPVKTDLSPALDPEFLKMNYQLGLNGSELRDVLRQKEASAILYNATQLRSQIEDNDLRIQLNVEYARDAKAISGQDLEDSLEQAISEFGLDEVKIICRSNKSANAYNHQFRIRILGLDDEITTADQIMVVKNNYHWVEDSEQIGFIANGDIANIERIDNYQELYGFKFADARLRFVDYPKAEPIDAKLLLNTLNEETPSLSREQHQALFNAVALDYEHIPTKKERLEKIKKDPFYNALQVKFAYALTCHKAQGGQWKSVFLDQGYLTEEMIDLNYLRWLYTAVTRAEEQLHFVNFHPDFLVS